MHLFVNFANLSKRERKILIGEMRLFLCSVLTVLGEQGCQPDLQTVARFWTQKNVLNVARFEPVTNCFCGPLWPFCDPPVALLWPVVTLLCLVCDLTVTACDSLTTSSL